MFLPCPTLAAWDSESPSLEAIHNLFRFQKASLGRRGIKKILLRAASSRWRGSAMSLPSLFELYESGQTAALGAQNISPSTYIPC